MSSARPAVRRKRRTAAKEERQLQLIKATIRSVAKRGLSETTMATVAGEAKLSQGIINLHFQSKDNLLVETLRYVADEYRSMWQTALAKTSPEPVDRLSVLVEADFCKPVCNRNRLAVRFAFWGESKSRPTYRRICAERDREYDQILGSICAEVIELGGYEEVDAKVVAASLSAMTEGLWLDMLVNPDQMDPELARKICFDYLGRVFPRHFGAFKERTTETRLQ